VHTNDNYLNAAYAKTWGNEHFILASGKNHQHKKFKRKDYANGVDDVFSPLPATNLPKSLQ